MKWMIATLVLLFAVTVVAQQPNMSTSPSMSNAVVRHDIQSTISTAPEFNAASVEATVNDNSVILTGYVLSQAQHDEALSVAASYAGDRQVVDQIQVGGFTDSAS